MFKISTATIIFQGTKANEVKFDFLQLLDSFEEVLLISLKHRSDYVSTNQIQNCKQVLRHSKHPFQS